MATGGDRVVPSVTAVLLATGWVIWVGRWKKPKEGRRRGMLLER